MPDHDPLWIAPREGHDWVCTDTLRAVNWLKSFVPRIEMEARIDRCREQYAQVIERWQRGDNVELFDPNDQAAWFVFQAETYASGRKFWVPDEAARIVPFITKLGVEYDRLSNVRNVEERTERMMVAERAQPDSTLFELLVAAANVRNGWTNVEFVAEQRGGAKTPDLRVAKKGARWAVECKRMRPSQYSLEENAIGKRLAAHVHDLSEKVGQSFVVAVRYHDELVKLPETALKEIVAEHIPLRSPSVEIPGTSLDVVIVPVQWDLLRSVMKMDYVYIGSSRMVELVAGLYSQVAEHSLRTRCRKVPKMPSYADTVYHASLVSWTSDSADARRAKAKHFRRKVAEAEAQLPDDSPGVVHIGMEATRQRGTDQFRHWLNKQVAHDFKNKDSRLRWIYGNYFTREVTTRPDESCAMVESMVPYPIGRHRTKEPLPGHLLIADETEAADGVSWR